MKHHKYVALIPALLYIKCDLFSLIQTISMSQLLNLEPRLQYKLRSYCVASVWWNLYWINTPNLSTESKYYLLTVDEKHNLSVFLL